MLYKQDDAGYREAVMGVMMKTLVHGEQTLCIEFRLEAGHTLPMHAHEQEQTGYLVSGVIRLTIEGELRGETRRQLVHTGQCDTRRAGRGRFRGH